MALAGLLDTTPKVQSMKEITDKLNFIKTKNFLERWCPENKNCKNFLPTIRYKRLFLKIQEDPLKTQQ